jgi:hypothetical protein
MVLKSSASSGAAGESTLYFGNGSQDDVGLLSYDHGNNSLTTRVNGAVRMTINAPGNVGIGTMAPSVRLHIKGAGTASQLAIEDATLGTNWQVGTNTGSVSNAHTFRIYSSEYGPDHGYLPLMQLSAANGSVILVPGLNTGNVGIGTTAPTHKLSVNGTVRAKEVIVDAGWADHVFAKDYRLVPLSEVKHHIQQNGHLPDLPSAAEVAERGVSVGDVQRLLLQKIEELTLHQIEQEERLNSQAERIRALETENANLRQR